ncbi:MAG: phosphoribosylamine--glycine ligase [Firmicutes bacterium]|nr:phosphoribosylamine--glycine ligase [Bacillota bacterium]
MNILVIGGGGREHAIIKQLRKSPRCDKIWALPGNGGIAADAECAPVAATDLDGVCAFAAAHPVDFAVVAPDDPLALGLVDRLHALGIPCFGPEAAAARIEASKSFAKELMAKYHIPTAEYALFSDYEQAKAYVEAKGAPIVIKADGLALGKGVTVAQTVEEAVAALGRAMLERAFGASGDTVLIEECLVGPEVTVLAFTDGHTLVPMVASMDHKRAQDGDRGPNTGGMGVIAPNPFYTPEIAAQCLEEIFLPTVRGMAADGHPFKGCLYFGLMLTAKGPKVIEYNCRFGDPEAQAVLPLLDGDLLEIMQAVEEERLDQVEVRFRPGASCCVVLASDGYPGHYEKGLPITDGTDPADADVTVFHAGTKLDAGRVVTNGGRVLAVTAVAEDLPAAVEKSYQAARQVTFGNVYYRHDIGQAALKALERK